VGTYNAQETEEERWLHPAHRQIEKKITDEGVMVAMKLFLSHPSIDFSEEKDGNSHREDTSCQKPRP